ncbi:maltokinase N-terminal cap-like domain-containing protein [Jiangella endophytica]|uniref:maltokinase N-terminal cap-like domain-containing protein n=1 Tax=Jiangella endophytica TaxID=1623398 RepID=UPI0018E54C85|nr:aminoglycoside phosphotransferase [Jiangella endophytica]
MTADQRLSEAVALLPEWLPHQHWFTGARTGRLDVRPVAAALLHDGEPRVWHLLAEVTHDDGADVYQVPLSVHSQRSDRLDHVHLGHTADGHVYDALHDKEATAVLLDHFADDAPAIDGLRFHVKPDVKVPYGDPSLVLPGEHHNTSLAYGDAALLKVFRRVDPGLNPDVELNEALSDAGCTLVAPLLGWVDGDWSAGDATPSGSLAMLRGFLTTASDGWALATASVRDLYAEGDLHADEVGGDFAAEAYRLGMATARVHETLAEVLPTATMAPSDLGALADAMTRRLDAAVAGVPELEPFAAGLRVHYDVLRRPRDPVTVQRIHGSYHLGQVLRTVLGWKLIDFEGELMAPVADRRAMHSPVRDVAQMLRSFDYAARHLLITDHPPEDPAHDQLVYRAHEWTQRNSEAFCNGYASASQLDPRHEPELLAAYESDTAVYEVVFEARRRPSWLPIPLAAVERLALPG